MMRNLLMVVVLFVLIAGATLPCRSQTTSRTEYLFPTKCWAESGSDCSHPGGQAVTKIAKSRIPDEIFLFGAVHPKAPPERCLKLAYDFDRLRQIPGYEAIEKFSNPPQLSDLKGYDYDSEDIKALKKWKPDDCEPQVPASSIQDKPR
jgi:hypothetical protein